MQTSLFYLRFDDVDGDGLDTRAVIWPTQLSVVADWSARWATTLDLTGVVASAVPDNHQDQDTEVSGAALANTFHVGLTQRFHWTRGFALWLRGRLVLAHAPAEVRARVGLSDRARLQLRARQLGRGRHRRLHRDRSALAVAQLPPPARRRLWTLDSALDPDPIRRGPDRRPT